MSKLLESRYSLDSALIVTLTVSRLRLYYSIDQAIGSWPSRPRPGLGLDFGLIHLKSNSLIPNIAHNKIVAVYKKVYRPSLIAFHFMKSKNLRCLTSFSWNKN